MSSEPASEWLKCPACLGLHTEESRVECRSAILRLVLKWVQLFWNKNVMVNIHLFWGLSIKINCIRIMKLLQQVKGKLADHSRHYRAALGRCPPGKQSLLKKKKEEEEGFLFPPSLCVQGTQVSTPTSLFLLCRSRNSGGQGDGAPRGSAM